MAVLALSAMQADLAGALGLGNVAVRSQLNQPLNAEIRLLETGDLDEAQVRVRLAGAEDFQRAGVERDYFLNNLQFSVELDQRGNGVVRVTTREPVVEPYLNFIIEARWPSGRLLREYAVLLDPPTFSADATPPAPRTDSGLATVQQRAAQATGPAAAPARQAAPTGRAGMPASREFPPATAEGEYRVQNSDTLSRIASRFRPSDDASVEQTMLAIQQANPDAFIRNNINLIKAGSVLRLPTADEVRSISADVATREVLAQNEAWRSGTDVVGSSRLAGPQLDARRGDADEASGPRATERLSIATAGQSDRNSAGDGTGAPDNEGLAALQGELLSAQESLDSARRENDELQSRLDEMESQMATLQKLLALKDDQLAALQASAGAAADNGSDLTGDGAEQSFGDDTAAADSNDSLADAGADVTADDYSQPASSESTDASPADETVAAVPPPAAAQPAPKPQAPRRPPEPDFWEKLLGNPWLPAGAAALLALLVGGVFAARRRRAQAEAEAVALAELEAAPDLAPAPVPVEPEVAVTTPAVAAAAAVSGADLEADKADEQPAAAPVRAETGDVVAEADIYIAYGRYQQAVNLLRGAIEQEPARSDIRVKLLEVYLEMRDREAFRQEFVALQALGDEQAVVQVKEMLSSVDGVSDWLNGLPGGSGGAFAAGLAAATAVAAAAAVNDDEEVEEEEELFADAPGEEFQLDLDETPVSSGNELDLDWLNEASSTATADDDGFVLDLDDDEPQPAVAGVAQGDDSDELDAAFDLGGPLVLDERDLDDRDSGEQLLGEAAPAADQPGAATLIEEPAPDETVPADVLGELDLDDDALDLGDDDLDRALSELGGDSDDALSAAFGNASGDELGGSDLAAPGGSDLGFVPTAELEPVASAEPTDTPPLEVDAGWLPLEPAADETAGADATAAGASQADDDLALELDAHFEFEPELLASTAELAGEPQLTSEPQPIASEPVSFAVEGLGDIDEAALDEQVGLDELGAVDAPETAASTDALDAAFADFEALGAELEAATAAPAAGDTAEDDFAVDLDAIAPYTEEVASADDADEFDFLADADEVATKLDLARAYIDMGDTDGARDILGEVVQEGTDPQREEAQALLDRIV